MGLNVERREYHTNEDEGTSIHLNMSESALIRNNFLRVVQVRPDCGCRFSGQSTRRLFPGFSGNRVLPERGLPRGGEAWAIIVRSK